MSKSISFVRGLSKLRTRSPLVVTAVAIVGLGLFVALPAVSASAPGKTGTALHAGEGTVTIEIPEVGCAGCSLEVRKAVKGAGGVVRLGEGDPKNRLVVTYEPGPGRPEVYADALRKAGFSKAKEVARN